VPPWLEAVILGIVQGITEFLPVSSDGHLVIIPYLAGMRLPGLALTVALHLGTFLAILMYFRREVWLMIKGVLRIGSGPDELLYRRLALLVIVGTLPVAVAGLLLREVLEGLFESPLLAAGLLVFTAAVLWVGEKLRDRRIRHTAPAPAAPAATSEPGRVWTGDWIGATPSDTQTAALSVPVGDDTADPGGRTLETIRLRDALIIGLLQPLALLPGVSRSGTTIVAGLGSGLTREAATRFSFLLGLPALAGAFIVELPALLEPGQYSGLQIGLSVATAFVAGYVAVSFLIRLVARDRLTGFAKYCLFMALVTVVAYQFLGPPSQV
jgi:undecaprenyl-diphosphatase